MTEFIAIVYEARSLVLRMIVNPDSPAQLDDPLLIFAPDETRRIVRVPRSHHPHLQKEILAADDIAYIQKNALAFIFRYR
jgi:hypothetical protein